MQLLKEYGIRDGTKLRLSIEVDDCVRSLRANFFHLLYSAATSQQPQPPVSPIISHIKNSGPLINSSGPQLTLNMLWEWTVAFGIP